MSKVVVATVLPDSGASDLLTIGAASDSVAISGDSLNVDTLQDAGGNTIFVSDGSGTITSKNSGFPGALKLISTATASGDSSLSFTSGIDSTYDVYIFKFIDINPVTDQTSFDFNGSTDGGSNYNVTKTTTAFVAKHNEADTDAALEYRTGMDLAQSTSYQPLAYFVGNLSDECCAGEFILFNPASTVYVKHFYSRANSYAGSNYTFDCYTGGYCNTTSAVNAVDFKMSSGNFDGIIKMYGISKS